MPNPYPWWMSYGAVGGSSAGAGSQPPFDPNAVAPWDTPIPYNPGDTGVRIPGSNVDPNQLTLQGFTGSREAFIGSGLSPYTGQPLMGDPVQARITPYWFQSGTPGLGSTDLNVPPPGQMNVMQTDVQLPSDPNIEPPGLPSPTPGGYLPPYQAMDVPPGVYDPSVQVVTANNPQFTVPSGSDQNAPAAYNPPMIAPTQPYDYTGLPYTGGYAYTSPAEPVASLPALPVQYDPSQGPPDVTTMTPEQQQMWLDYYNSQQTAAAAPVDTGGGGPPLGNAVLPVPDEVMPAGPGNQLPNAPGTNIAVGSPGVIDPSTGLPIPGTAVSPEDAARAYNFGPQSFPTVAGAPSGWNDPTNYPAVGQFFRDAAGNIVDAVGNIVRGAGDFLSNAFDPNQPGYSAPQDLVNMGYTYSPVSSALLPPEGFGGARGGPLAGSFAGLGSGGGGQLPNEWANAFGKPWTGRRPFDYNQWQQWMGFQNYQGNPFSGVNWRQWAQQTGNPMPIGQPPNYQAYLNQWNLLQPEIARVAAARAAAQPGDVIGHIAGGGSQSHGTPGTHPA